MSYLIDTNRNNGRFATRFGVIDSVVAQFGYVQMPRSRSVESWLKEKLAWNRASAIFVGVGLSILAAVVLFVTFWIIYLIIFLATCAVLPQTHETRLIISGVVLVLVLIGNASTDRRRLEDFSFTTGTVHGKPVSIYVPFVGLGSTINPLAPDSIHSQIKVLASVLRSGPRLAAAALRSFVKFWRLLKVDTEGCAAILTALAAADSSVPFVELASAIPPTSAVGAVLTQVQDIYGVMLMTKEPPGLSLYSSLREELRKLGPKRWKGNRQAMAEEKDDGRLHGQSS